MLRQAHTFPISPGAINLRSVDGSPLEIRGYTRFTLAIGDKPLPVEALVLPILDPDQVLLDNSFGGFKAILDCYSQTKSSIKVA